MDQKLCTLSLRLCFRPCCSLWVRANSLLVVACLFVPVSLFLVTRWCGLGCLLLMGLVGLCSQSHLQVADVGFRMGVLVIFVLVISMMADSFSGLSVPTVLHCCCSLLSLTAYASVTPVAPLFLSHTSSLMLSCDLKSLMFPFSPWELLTSFGSSSLSLAMMLSYTTFMHCSLSFLCDSRTILSSQCWLFDSKSFVKLRVGVVLHWMP